MLKFFYIFMVLYSSIYFGIWCHIPKSPDQMQPLSTISNMVLLLPMAIFLAVLFRGIEEIPLVYQWRPLVKLVIVFTIGASLSFSMTGQ